MGKKGSRVKGPGSKITVRNLNKKRGINERFVAKLARAILRIIKRNDKDLEIIFLNNAAIKPINKKYKNSPAATDVLSFDLGSCGQILISSDMALKNSRAFNTSLEKELVLYVIHGILHLFGYDDEDPKTESRMFRKQNSVLETLCAKVNLSKVLMPR